MFTDCFSASKGIERVLAFIKDFLFQFSLLEHCIVGFSFTILCLGSFLSLYPSLALELFRLRNNGLQAVAALVLLLQSLL